MHDLDLAVMGLQPIVGDDVYGGRLSLGLATAIIGIVAFLNKEWPEMKQGFSDGYNGV